MKNWKLAVATVALGVGLSGITWAQPVQDWHQDQRQTDNDRHDRDRDRDRDHRQDRDRDHDRDNRYRGQRGDRDRDDNGYYRSDRDRDYGYRNGRYGYGNGAYGYGRNGARNDADQWGYRDGFSHGQGDAATGRRFDSVGSQNYKDGNHGYNSSLGDENLYRQEYRQAYQQGYQAGYYGGRGR